MTAARTPDPQQGTRERLIRAMLDALRTRGFHGVGISELLAEAQAPKGVIYHHFPGGKAELIEAVLEDFTTLLDDQLQALHGQPAEAVVQGALALWRGMLLRDDCESGCPVVAVTVAADSSGLMVILGCKPAAMATIIVSPTAREIAST